MKCIKCDYPLWNLRQPRCPECGEAFDVRDWRYNSKHVAFLCTHCQQKLGPHKPGPIDKTCPGCDHLIDWASVSVVPLIDDVSQIARRKIIERKAHIFVLRILILSLCLAVGFAYVLGPQLAGRPSAPSVTFLLLSFIAGLVIAIFTIASADKKYRTIHIMIWTILLSIWSFWITQSYLSRARNYESFRWWGESSSTLTLLHKALEIYLTQNAPPPSIKLLAVENYFSPDFLLIEGSDTTLEDITIGSLTLQDFVDGDVTKEQLWLVAEQNLIQGEWEIVGDLVLSRQFDLYDKQDPKIIIGICLIPSRDGKYSVQYADGSSEVLAPNSNWIAAQNKLRKSQGLEPLPDLP